ncbi:TetR family transcriptional regulator [Amycolatopsis balhimycina DSM 5908]|uniref:TetR family transcriptional regulator n=1 Tax=Amycolatopsis balhimycina DSM 5908 TaxID=1081091 RepID=A0A428X6H6_AMYBA|nr:TetR family transcriptional regulator [Amycolatopsis balhimycina]RSM50920.1 TetR family transcriptional regulator [Amycolatopsis balhimycina DSM 5908]
MSARRAPRPEDRGRAAEQTRERILDAAMAEFGAKGYAGARTAGIAARAGVNPQLISYYFGGKQGLLEELRRRWQEIEASVAAPDASFGASVAAHLDATLDRPDWARLVVWQALGDCPFADAEEGERYAQAQRDRLAKGVQRIRERRDAGEVTGDIDPRFALLVTYAVVFSPIALPQFVRGLLGDDPLSPAVRRWLHDQLIKLLGAAGD